jgi:isopentenyl-diphosphate delta-isomerase
MDIMIPAWVDGKLTPVEKLEAHQRGLKHKAVSVFVMAQGRVLIQQRAAHKYHTPGLWANTCCTHPEWDEAPEVCAIRRLDDELGIKGLAPKHRGTVEYRADVGGDLIEHEVVEVYLAEATLTHPMQPNPDEVMATRWVDYETLISEVRNTPDLFTPWLSIYLAKHRDLIFGDLVAAE